MIEAKIHLLNAIFSLLSFCIVLTWALKLAGGKGHWHTYFLALLLFFKKFMAFLSFLFGPFLRIFQNNDDSYARFATKREEKKILSKKNSGLRISKNKFLSQQNSEKHLILAAPSGAGKSSCYSIPATLETMSSLIITDLAGEIFDKTSGHLSEMGFDVLAINMRDPERSEFFNPLLRTKDDPHKLRRLLTSITNGAIQGGETFWAQSAISVLFVLASGLINYEDERYITLKNLKILLSHFGTEELDAFLLKYINDPAVFAEYKSIRSTSDNTISSIIATCRAAMQIFDDPVIEKIFSKDTMDISKLRAKKTVLYLICPEVKAQFFSVPINLIFEELFDCLIETPLKKDSVPVSIIMDEFGNLASIQQMDVILSVARKRKISISLIVQSTHQLSARMGKDIAQVILGGTISSKLLFPGLDTETCQAAQTWLGNKCIRNPKTGQETKNPLLTADSIRMQSGTIFIHGASRPIKLKKMVPYFKDRKLRKYSEKPPYELPANQRNESFILDLSGMTPDRPQALEVCDDYLQDEAENLPEPVTTPIIPSEEIPGSPLINKSEIVDLQEWRQKNTT